MAHVAAPPEKKAARAVAGDTIRMVVTMTSKDSAAIERACGSLINNAIKMDIPHRGPKRLPTRILVTTTRKSPCGEGTNTWDRFEMRVFKRVVEVVVPRDKMKTISGFELPPGVEVDVASKAFSKK